jgi:hypothetical protein
MYRAISSKSLKARGENSTRKGMTFLETPLCLFEWDSFAAFDLLHSLTDRRYGLGTLQSIEQLLTPALSGRECTVSATSSPKIVVP